MALPEEPGIEEEEEVDDGDDQTDKADFDFENSRGTMSNYLDLSTSTLTGLLYNSKQKIVDTQADINAWEPWSVIRDAHKNLLKGKIEKTESNIQAVNLAQTVTKTLQQMDSIESKNLAYQLIEKSMYHYVKGPNDLADAEKEKGLITTAYSRVSVEEADTKAEKAKREAAVKLSRIEADESGVESSGVARKRRRSA